MSIEDAIQNYNERLIEGQLASQGRPGKQRGLGGALFESLADDLVACSDRQLAPNRFVTSREIDGLSLGNIQVDKHLEYNGRLETLVECKAYIEASMLKRVVYDFNEVCQSPDGGYVRKLAVLAGQSSIADVTRVFTTSVCKQLTGLDLEIFVVNTAKHRDSTKQLFDPAFSDNFTLDPAEVERFVHWLST